MTGNPLLSRRTLAIMGRVFNSIIDRTISFGPQKFRYNPKYPTAIVDSLMYEMGFEQEFIETCGHQYFWDFSAVIRELESGKFRPPGYQPSTILLQNHRHRAEPYLLKLAAFCSRMCSNGIFLEQAADLAATLERDGWVYEEGALHRIDQEGVDKPAERSRIEILIGASKLDSRDVLERHFLEAVRLTRIGSFHASVNEWRSFYISLLQQIWRRTKAARNSEFNTHAEVPSISDTFKYLVKSGFLTADEKLAYDSAYGFLCGGSHPGISEKEDAHLAEILCLMLGQALLLKFKRWAANDYRGF